MKLKHTGIDNQAQFYGNSLDELSLRIMLICDYKQYMQPSQGNKALHKMWAF